MLQNRNILCIANPPWQGSYSSTTVELMRIFGTENKVLYAENPITIVDAFRNLVKGNTKDLGRVFGLKARYKTVQQSKDGSVILYYPPAILTINFLKAGALYDKLNKFNGWLVARSLRKVLKKLDMRSALINIVSFNPALGETVGKKVGEQVLIYHCYDEIASATWMQKHGPKHERSLMKIADGTIVTSQWLLETKSKLTGNCFLVKNAANVPLFATGFNPEVSEKKTVGFIGSIDERLDYDLLRHLVVSLPGYHFIFIGRVVGTHGQELRSYPNVEFVAPQRVEALPAFVRSFSVGIIPFLKNEFTKGIYPLKINEYLAAGVPVVATNFSYLDEFRSVAAIVENADEFLAAVITETGADNIDKRKQRMVFAKSNSWEDRVNTFSEIVEQLENNAHATRS